MIILNGTFITIPAIVIDIITIIIDVGTLVNFDIIIVLLMHL